MLRGQVHGLIEEAALNDADFRLIIGVSNIQVNVRHYEERPLFLWIELLREFCCVTVKLYLNLRWCARGKFGHCDQKTLFSEFLIATQRFSVMLARNLKVH